METTAFVVARHYTREEVAEVIELPTEKRSGGSWMTGYDEWNDAAFIFTNVGVAGRTGHNYPNRWDDKHLIWYGKTHARRGQPQIDRMISNRIPVHIFWRGEDRSPFTYAGNATAIDASDETPVRVTWDFGDAAPGTFQEMDARREAQWRRGPPPHSGQDDFIRFDGPTDMYLLKLEGKTETFFPTPPGYVVIKVGISNDVVRRLAELNVGFPPGAPSRGSLHASEPSLPRETHGTQRASS